MASPKITNLRDALSNDEIAELSSSENIRHAIDEEWMEIAELGFYYGFEAIMAVLTNKIDAPTMTQLILAGRKLSAINTIDSANAARAAYWSGKSQDSLKAYNNLLKPYFEEIKHE